MLVLSPDEDERRRQELREAWLRWLYERHVPWQVLGHLTFVGGRAGLSDAGKTWLRFMNAITRRMKPLSRRQARDQFLWVRAIERHAKGGAHIHFAAAAPSGLSPLDPARLRRLWRAVGPAAGRQSIDTYQPSLDVHAHKYLFKEAGLDVDILPSVAAANFPVPDS